MKITLDQWQAQLSKDPEAIILDVRTQEEMEEGCFDNALLLDIKNPSGFMEEAQKLDPTKPYYVHCKSGARSTQACLVLASMGFDSLYELIDGYDGYKESLEE